MRLIRDLANLKPEDRGVALAIGNFDGLHRGHLAVLEALTESAKRLGVSPAVMTFEPHPRCYFQPERDCDRLISVDEKLRLLRQAGIERVFALRFNERMASLPAEAFMSELLVRDLQVKHLVTGADFVFGHRRGGTSETLAQAAKQGAFSYQPVAPLGAGAQKFSSTDIRAAIREGDIPTATQMLGRPYRWVRPVMHGDARGRELGFPTANLRPPPVLLPKRGVYSVWAQIEGTNERMAGVANLGIRPTFGGSAARLEVHLLDRKINLYDQRLCVDFHAFIRPEQPFEGIDALRRQITQDCQTAQHQLGL